MKGVAIVNTTSRCYCWERKRKKNSNTTAQNNTRDESLCVYVCIHMYVYKCTCVYTNSRTYVYFCKCVSLSYVCLYVVPHTRAQTHILPLILTWHGVFYHCMHTHMRTYLHSTHTYTPLYLRRLVRHTQKLKNIKINLNTKWKYT